MNRCTVLVFVVTCFSGCDGAREEPQKHTPTASGPTTRATRPEPQNHMAADNVESNRGLLRFRGEVKKIELVLLPDKYKFGVRYDEKIFRTFASGGHVVVGIDANFRVEFANVEFRDQDLFPNTLSKLNVHIHSPTQSALRGLRKQFAPDENEFELSYSISEGYVSFSRFSRALGELPDSGLPGVTFEPPAE